MPSGGGGDTIDNEIHDAPTEGDAVSTEGDHPPVVSFDSTDKTMDRYMDWCEQIVVSK